MKKLWNKFKYFIKRLFKISNKKGDDMADYDIVVKDENGSILGGGGVLVGAVEREISIPSNSEIVIATDPNYKTAIIPLTIGRGVYYKAELNSRIVVKNTHVGAGAGIALLRGYKS